MPRTDSGRVCAILDTELEKPQIQAFIQTANLMVTEVLGSSDLSAGMLTEIETYLAAHFITMRDRRVSKEAADGVSFTFEGKTGEGLDSSMYGQTAQELDSTGKLKAIGNEDAVGWIARAGSERTNTNYRLGIPPVSSL